MTPTQPTATTTEALRLPEGTLSMQGNDITIAYATREDAERAFDVLEAALSTAPSGDGVPGSWVADRQTLAEAANDPALSDGAVRALCVARVGEITPEIRAWAEAALSTASSTGKETP